MTKCLSLDSMFWCVVHGSEWYVDDACETVQREAEDDAEDAALERMMDDKIMYGGSR